MTIATSTKLGRYEIRAPLGVGGMGEGYLAMTRNWIVLFTETIVRITHAQPEAIACFNYDVPAELEVIIKKALRRNRGERYQTAHEMLIDLRDLQQDLHFASRLEHSVAPTLANPRRPRVLGKAALSHLLGKVQPVQFLLMFPAPNLGMLRKFSGFPTNPHIQCTMMIRP